MGQTGKLSPKDLSTKIKALSLNGVIAGIPVGTTNTLAFDDAVNVTEIQQALAALPQKKA